MTAMSKQAAHSNDEPIASSKSCCFWGGLSRSPQYPGSGFRPHTSLEPAKVLHVRGVADVLADVLENLRRGPPPVFRVPVGESECAALIVPVGRQVPPP